MKSLVSLRNSSLPLAVQYIHTNQYSHDSTLNGFRATVGNTPLIKLEKFSAETKCNILVKAEYMNPGGSVKDRAALYLIKQAIESKKISFDKGSQPIIVEGTAGNTGIGLAHICNTLGFRCFIFMPNNQSREKIDSLQILGAQVFEFPVVPWSDPNNYNHKAREFAEKTPNSFWTNQFDNVINRQAHIETTGPEIWKQTNGKVDAVVFGVGTGGTLSGVSKYLKSKNPNIKAYAADPQGSVLYNYYTNGKLERTEGSSITEGIGQGRLTDNLKNAEIDGAFLIKDTDLIHTTFRLLHEEGFFVGASSGLNVHAALQVAKKLGPNKTIVTCLCDSGAKYINKLYSRNELDKRGLLNSVPEAYRKYLKP